MSFLDQIKQDVQAIVSDPDGMTVQLTLTAPNNETATITGLGTKHNFEVDMQTGRGVNSKNTHFGFSEKTLSDANPNYPIRNTSGNNAGEVNLSRHRVSYADSTGVVKEYIIEPGNWHADETIGYIQIGRAHV